MDYSIKDIPAWLIEKECRGAKYADAACILAIQDGTAAFIRETEKALLFEWGNQSLICCKASGGKFWVPKSVLKGKE